MSRKRAKAACACTRNNPEGESTELPIEPAQVTPGIPADLSPCVQFVRLEKVPEEYAACMGRFGEMGKIQTAKDVYQVLKDWYAKQDQEVGVILLLDVQLGVRGAAEVSRGERDSTVVPIADILRVALVDGASAVVFCHNHPTGHSTPSDDDKTSTLALARACDAVNLTLMDHVIFGADEYFSFADAGLLSSELTMPEEAAPESPIEPEGPPEGEARVREHVRSTTSGNLAGKAFDYLGVTWELRQQEWERGGDLYLVTLDGGRYGGHGAIRVAVDGSWRDASTLLPVSEVEPWITYINRGREARGLSPLPTVNPASVEDRTSGARRGWEHRRERDEWVVQNLEPYLLPLWERIKGSLRGTPEERYEAFMQYVHDHPGGGDGRDAVRCRHQIGRTHRATAAGAFASLSGIVGFRADRDGA
jgi:hypothetical protein